MITLLMIAVLIAVCGLCLACVDKIISPLTFVAIITVMVAVIAFLRL